MRGRRGIHYISPPTDDQPQVAASGSRSVATVRDTGIIVTGDNNRIGDQRFDGATPAQGTTIFLPGNVEVDVQDVPGEIWISPEARAAGIAVERS